MLRTTQTAVLILLALFAFSCTRQGSTFVEDPNVAGKKQEEQEDDSELETDVDTGVSSDDRDDDVVDIRNDEPEEDLDDELRDEVIVPDVDVNTNQEPVITPDPEPIVPEPVTQPQPVLIPQNDTNTNSSNGNMLIAVTPFSNMASGHQATNPGMVAFLKSGGQIVAAGPLTMESVIRGRSDDASQGGAYGRLILDIEMEYMAGAIESGAAAGSKSGQLSICMNANPGNLDNASCRSIGGNLHPERPFQWIDKPVTYSVQGTTVKITSFEGDTGEGGTRDQIALAVYHPAYGFAAPGKAFKDYQSPVILDLDRDGEFSMIDVWNDDKPVAFDLNGDGLVVRTGWVAGNDAFLALDVNGDGKINSGVELFGEYSAGAKPDHNGRTFKNGYLALGAHDKNYDGIIDSQDAVFKKLLIWRDKNHDGTSQPGELQTLAASDIASLSLFYKRTGTANKPDTVKGNELRLRATYKTKSGKEYKTADAWFKQRRGSNVAGQ